MKSNANANKQIFKCIIWNNKLEDECKNSDPLFFYSVQKEISWDCLVKGPNNTRCVLRPGLDNKVN